MITTKVLWRPLRKVLTHTYHVVTSRVARKRITPGGKTVLEYIMPIEQVSEHGPYNLSAALSERRNLVDRFTRTGEILTLSIKIVDESGKEF